MIDAERLAGELPLFTQDFSTVATAADDPLRDRLETVNPDLLAPREALELLYELRELLNPSTDGGT